MGKASRKSIILQKVKLPEPLTLVGEDGSHRKCERGGEHEGQCSEIHSLPGKKLSRGLLWELSRGLPGLDTIAQVLTTSPSYLFCTSVCVEESKVELRASFPKGSVVPRASLRANLTPLHRHMPRV